MVSGWLWPLAAGGLTAALCRWILDPASPLHVLDQPGHRSLHARPTPRTGGLAMMVAVGVVAAVAVAAGWVTAPAWLAWIAGGTVLLVAVGLADDLADLSPALRLGVQLVAAALVLVAGLAPQGVRLPGFEWTPSPALAALFTLLLVLWMTNLYNFMDGMDGLAGTMTLVGFGTLGWLTGDPALRLAAWSLAGAAAGFLWFNRPPARLFMGDAGAPVLGYLAAVLLLWAARRGELPLWAGGLLFSPFVVDATYTLIRRSLRGERIWQAHCSHLYQKLVRRGWSHRRVLVHALGLMLAAAVSAGLATRLPPAAQAALAGGWLLFYAGLIMAVERYTAELA